MKVIRMNIQQNPRLTDRVIKDTLYKDIDAFRGTDKQFLRNNPAFFYQRTAMMTIVQ
jgi:hypothetical protein